MDYKNINYSFLPLKFILLCQLMNLNLIFCEKKDIDYSLKLRLNNGNYLMLATKGIYIYNPTLTSKIDVKIFESRLTDDHEQSYPTNAAQFLSEDDGYIICLIRNITYIVSKSGVYRTDYTLDYMRTRSSYPIIPYGHSGNQYYYLIITVEEQNIIFRKYIYDSSSNTISFNNSYYYNTEISLYKSIGCELMYYSNQKVISCIYGDWNNAYCKVFNIINFESISGMGGHINDGDNGAGGQHYQSAIMIPGRTKVAFCSQHVNNLIAYIYNISENNFIKISTVTSSGCDCEPFDSNIEYFPEREEFLYYCVGKYEVYSGRLSKNNIFENLPTSFLINTTVCGKPHRINLGYSSGLQKYFIYADSDCQQVFNFDNIEAPKFQDYPTDEAQAICDKYYNYDKTDCYDTVPDGYYCNNTEAKTIDKCYQNCQTCEKGPTNYNNNCLTCKDSKYYDLGNCSDQCINGNFTDSDNITKCKCSTNITCKYCTDQSKQYNLCESCNNEEGYYPKLNDENNINNSIINCYNNDSISDGYYLNSITGYYEQCYSTCKKCNELGIENNNKCTECINGYQFKTDFENDYNCYEICTKYYYFDSNKIYHCVDQCPNNYCKLIESKNKCIDECSKDPIYKYEIDNKCYDSCGTKYFSFDQKECIDIIPDGYYCNDTNLKTIDKCHNNCATCKEGPTNDNNNCLTCKDSKYLDLGNCVDECPNGYFTDIDNINKCKCSSNIACKYCSNESKIYNLCVSCNNDEGYYPKYNDELNINSSLINCYNNDSISDGYFLNIVSKYYEQCYSTCKKCNKSGDEDNNNCLECKSGYQFKTDFENDYNCYDICDKYYYFDSNKKYYCVDECPSKYNKVLLESRCVNKCSEFENYKFEFENICYNKCPSISHISEDNEFLCIPNLNCNDKYYSFDQKECIDIIPDGYYCNDTNLKTIDKCHNNCATCKEGPTNDNNNCLTCKDSKYLDLGNCVDECPNGYFTDIDNINKCKCSSNIACKYCSNESKLYNLCVTCNNEQGYYTKIDDEIRNDLFINCYKEPERYFLDNNIKKYKPCYSKCKRCNELGDDSNNKCIDCISGYEFKEDFENDYNCYEKCHNYYYFDIDKKYHCTNDNDCPNNYKMIISKKKCINDCSKDNNYKYEYQNICYEKCPINTKSKNNSFICEEIIEESEEECKLVNNEFLSFKKDISIDDLNPLTKNYANDYFATNGYITTYENKYISIYIYKNISCLKKTKDSAPHIDFGECYQNVKDKYNITEELIVSIININSNEKSKPLTTYAFSNPITGEILNTSEICANEKIVIQEDVKSLMENIDNRKEEFIIFCTNQGIDVFNISDIFYNDLCFHFESPNGRDIPLKERISLFYPNISLCDKGCENKGVNLETLKAKCVCAFNDIMNNNLITDNLYGQYIGEVMDLITSLNIAVVQCIKDIFVKDYFIKCTGAFIFLFIFLCQIICIIKFLIEGIYKIRKFFFSLTESYSQFISNNKDNNNNQNNNNKKTSINNNQNDNKKLRKINHPPRIKRAKSKMDTNLFESDNKSSIKRELKKSNSSISNINSFLSPKTQFKKGKKSLNNFEILKNKPIIEKYRKTSFNELRIKTKNYPSLDKVDIKEYLSMSFDENDFEDVIDKDKRTFSQYFCEKCQDNQLFIKTFYIKESLRPRVLKILVLIDKIKLYFVVNALFYTEEYLSEISNIDEKDSFFAFVPRRINHFFYIYGVVGIISYIIDFFFIEEKKIKKIFIRNKEGEMKIKYDISLITKDIEKRFKILIICSIITTILCFIYISCFNIVYPYTKIEWIKSSIFIILITQLINIILTFIECCIRYIAIKCNSDKLF